MLKHFEDFQELTNTVSLGCHYPSFQDTANYMKPIHLENAIWLTMNFEDKEVLPFIHRTVYYCFAG